MNSDLIELLEVFQENSVRYLIVGGYAVSFHAQPRYTKDLDIWVATDRKNANAVYKSLKQFNAPLHGATPKDFEDVDAFFFFGAAPNRVDILLGPPGPDFEDAWPNRVTRHVGDIEVNYVSREDLIEMKMAAGRSIDKRDIAMLKDSDPRAITKHKKAKKSK